jgi:heme exporter protein A
MELTARGVGKRFGRRVIFRRLDLTAVGGRSMAIVGANGSGKSTLVRILAGVMRPTRGTVELKIGDDLISHEERPFRTGLVAPYLDVYDDFSPAENLGFILRARSMREPRERIEAVLGKVDLSDRANDRVATFSSGLRQRMRLAVALVSDPPILLLDEPTSNLDDRGKESVRRILSDCVADGRIVIVATNEASEAEACDDRVSVMDFR